MNFAVIGSPQKQRKTLCPPPPRGQAELCLHQITAVAYLVNRTSIAQKNEREKTHEKVNYNLCSSNNNFGS